MFGIKDKFMTIINGARYKRLPINNEDMILGCSPGCLALNMDCYAQPVPQGISWVSGQVGNDELEDNKENEDEKAKALVA